MFVSFYFCNIATISSVVSADAFHQVNRSLVTVICTICHLIIIACSEIICIVWNGGQLAHIHIRRDPIIQYKTNTNTNTKRHSPYCVMRYLDPPYMCCNPDGAC